MIEDAAPPGSTGDEAGRRAAVARAIAEWTGQLVDLGGRNTLLHYRDLKQGTLDLSPGVVADAVTVHALLGGRSTRLSALCAGDALPAAAKRSRTVLAKAAENEEERGLRTLSIAWGMATWVNQRGASTPNAPLLLSGLTITPRSGVAEDFDLKVTGEWEVNPTLLHLLRTDHRVVLDHDELLANVGADGDDALSPTEASAIFAVIATACAEIPGFSITERVVVGNFSYAKQPMVDDLLAAAAAIEAHPLVAALAGSTVDVAAIRARHPDVTIGQPDVTAPADEFLVLDADSSQSWVINTAVAGGDLVVQGPPGTGKSQTIANLIATLAARGQRTLFVAEKRAAIDAVVDRLDRVGIGDIVLDLHGGGGHRRQVAADLAATMARLAQSAAVDRTRDDDELARRRSTLNETSHALHRARDPWGLSVYAAQSRALGLPAASRSAVRMVGPALAALDARGQALASDDLAAWIDLGGPAVRRGATPWAAASATVVSAESAAAALASARSLATTTLPSASPRLTAVLAECGLRAPETFEGWAAHVDLLTRVTDVLARLSPAAFGADLAALIAALAPAAGGVGTRMMATLTNGAYRAAKRSAKGLALTAMNPSITLAALIAALAARTDWAALATDGAGPRSPADLATVTGAHRQLVVELDGLAAWIGRAGLVDRPLDEITGVVARLIDDQPTLSRLPRLHELSSGLSRAGLAAVVDEIAARGLSASQARELLDHVWLHSILEQVALADPLIGAFDGTLASHVVTEYRARDAGLVVAGAAKVRRAVAEAAVRARDEYPQQSDLIEAEVRKKRRHRPIRELVQMAPNVLTAIKPCWVMSPLVVAQLLPSDRPYFDVVVFDEASQIPPADAMCALLRARQAVVAGDSKQLPPTSFFANAADDDPPVDQPELVDGQQPQLAGDMQSILDAMGVLLHGPERSRTLGWHYRSRDDRLIAFSNAQAALYDWSLTTFPGVSGADCLRHVLVPWTPDAPGDQESVAAEVDRVVELVAQHARDHPDETLGVIAMGITHANRITEAIRLARPTDPSLDAFCDAHPGERFFVKNLERVQGDERDAIVLSVGYGKNAEGRLMHRFGPLNMDGGERRLNVAITRSRRRMTVVSSFASADMDPAKLRAEGAAMLGRYLAYAESGGSDLGQTARERPRLDDFQLDVRDELIRAGVPVTAQFGVSGNWIELAAASPTDPTQMVLAIEADGPAYAAASTARDRDRLREEHLERLGWSFHRIWSLDWHHRRDQELARIVASYRAATAGLLDASDPTSTTPRTVPASPSSASQPLGFSAPTEPSAAVAAASAIPARGPRPPVQPGRSIGEYTPNELDSIISWLRSDTLLRTEDELIELAMDDLGFSRRGPRILEALTASVARTGR